MMMMMMMIAWLILLEASNPIIIQQIQPNAKYTKKIYIIADGDDDEHLFHDDHHIHERYLFDDNFDDLIYDDDEMVLDIFDI